MTTTVWVCMGAAVMLAGMILAAIGYLDDESCRPDGE
jgi:hypothetical protein